VLDDIQVVKTKNKKPVVPIKMSETRHAHTLPLRPARLAACGALHQSRRARSRPLTRPSFLIALRYCRSASQFLCAGAGEPLAGRGSAAQHGHTGEAARAGEEKMRHSMRTDVRLLFSFFFFTPRPAHPLSFPRFSYSNLQFISFSLSCVLLVCLSILFVCVSLPGRLRALSFSPHRRLFLSAWLRGARASFHGALAGFVAFVPPLSHCIAVSKISKFVSKIHLRKI
jgi:hypothetical protein